MTTQVWPRVVSRSSLALTLAPRAAVSPHLPFCLQGKAQLISNINACQAVAEAVRTTLGPRGMDKLISDGSGKATISNDGAKILQLLDVVHPAAATLVDIARAQDAEIGDGTTTVTLLAAELLKVAKPFVEDGVHPQIIIRVRIWEGGALLG